jgi:dTDP-glucose pyrophosphorylase
MNVLVLMAGGDSSFQDAGFLYPKNLVEIDGLPLVQRVIESLGPLQDPVAAQLACCVNEEEDRQHHTASVIRLVAPGAAVIRAQAKTGGAACTALLAAETIQTDEPLLIVNGDQIIHADLAAAVLDFERRKLDGGIVVFPAVHPRWSYVRTDAQGRVVEAAEKRPISKQATAGVYYFARGADFVSGAMSMIKKDAHTGGRFYVCPVYNELVLRQLVIGTFAIDREAYFSLSDPQGVRAYEDQLRAEAGLRPRSRSSLRPSARPATAPAAVNLRSRPPVRP